MKRNIDLKDISDGKLYCANDMVRADCHDCKGCSSCCSGMGQSIVLDPYDIYRLCGGLETDFRRLLEESVELNVVDGLILPNLKMKGEQERCGFLNKEGRCSVHPYRPGICRMFPLGRVYEEEGFRYFLQVHECPVANKGKVKVKKWIDTPNLNAYEKYIGEWHSFMTVCQEELSALTQEQVQILSTLILRSFYMEPYGEDFYEDFYQRLERVKNLLNLS